MERNLKISYLPFTSNLINGDNNVLVLENIEGDGDGMGEAGGVSLAVGTDPDAARGVITCDITGACSVILIIAILSF